MDITQEIKIACIVCCPMCDEKKCVGRYNCKEIEEYIQKSRRETMKEDEKCSQSE